MKIFDLLVKIAIFWGISFFSRVIPVTYYFPKHTHFISMEEVKDISAFSMSTWSNWKVFVCFIIGLKGRFHWARLYMQS